jgi:hypothetical protein
MTALWLVFGWAVADLARIALGWPVTTEQHATLAVMVIGAVPYTVWRENRDRKWLIETLVPSRTKR